MGIFLVNENVTMKQVVIRRHLAAGGAAEAGEPEWCDTSTEGGILAVLKLQTVEQPGERSSAG